MSENISNRRIAKNTLALYARTFFVLIVSLYTSRVLLRELGVDDFGVYNVVGGVSAMFAFLTNSVTSAVQRFFTYDLGKGDKEHYKKIYSSSFNVLVVVSLIIFVACETVGLWFVYYKLNIPDGRMTAALWVFQFCILTFISTFIRAPYMASIIAHERMNYYAYLSIAEYTLKFIFVYFLALGGGDKLILYSLYYFLVTLAITVAGQIYCSCQFEVCKYKVNTDRELFSQLINFSSWTIVGQLAVIIFNQGRAFMVNIFYGVGLNATMGIAGQVTSAIDTFVSNFQMAFNPQLTKTYATNDLDGHRTLLYMASKVSFYLMLLFAVPILFHLDYILKLWLYDVPEYTAMFVQIGIFSRLLSCLSSPCTTSIYAVGKISKYQVDASIIFILGLVGTYPLLLLGLEPYTVVIADIVIQMAVYLLRLLFMKKFNILFMREYFIRVMIPVFAVSVVSFGAVYGYNRLVGELGCNIGILIGDTIALVLMVCGISFYLGMTKSERVYLLKLIKKRQFKSM